MCCCNTHGFGAVLIFRILNFFWNNSNELRERQLSFETEIEITDPANSTEERPFWFSVSSQIWYRNARKMRHNQGHKPWEAVEDQSFNHWKKGINNGGLNVYVNKTQLRINMIFDGRKTESLQTVEDLKVRGKKANLLRMELNICCPQHC